MQSKPKALPTPGGHNLYYCYTEGKANAKPGVMFFGGFRSDMSGTKAVALEAYCREMGLSFVRFDYSGHGISEGNFADGTIGSWLADALLVMDQVTKGPLILVGSSMGAWIMLHAAMERPKRVVALLGLASAPDFTEELILPQLTSAQREAIQKEGKVMVPSAFPGPDGSMEYPITKAFLEDGTAQRVLTGNIPFGGPVRLLHGTGDEDVPPRYSQEVAKRLSSRDVKVQFLDSEDHRLSSPKALETLKNTLEELVGLCEHRNYA